MKKIVSYLLLVVCVLSLQAQQMPKPSLLPIKGNGVNTFLSHKENKNPLLQNAFSDRFCLYNIDGKEYISLLVKVDKNNDLSFLKNYDVILGSRQGRILTLKINTEELARFCEQSEIIEIETARKAVSPLLNISTKTMHVPEVWEGLDLERGYTGKGVIVGVADWGIDYTHPNFYDTLMQEYRILAAWDQFRTSGPVPEGFSYGTLIEGKNDLLNAQCDTANIYGYGYHATHVAGITGGGGASTVYKGVAPEVEWLFCTWIPDETSVLDAFAWMRDYAKQLGKRLVINNSWGLYIYGYMDGSSMLDEFINDMSEQDSVVFTVSAGNNGEEKFHLEADFSNTTDTLKTEVGFGTSSVSNYWGETVTLQGEDNTTFSTKIEIYDRLWQKVHESNVLLCDGSVIGDTMFVVEEGDTIIYRASSRYPADNRPLIDWEVRKTKLDNSFTHVVLCIKANGGKVHAWNVACLTTAVGNWGYDFMDSKEGFLAGNSEYGISEPAVAEKVITVGATKARKVNQPSTIALFSSKGPTLCPYLKPEIVAPGQSIVSSVSSFTTSSLMTITTNFEGKDYPFSAVSGTSMSCPMVTGSVALMLEANPYLSPQEVKDIIIQTADTNVNSGTCPNDIWGYGNINTYKAVQRAEAKVGLSQINNFNTLGLYPVPAQNILYLKNFQIKGMVTILDMTSRVVLNTKVNNSQIDISSLSSGVYIICIRDGENVYQNKFVKK
ncbi:MAG: S8/S53 family peptidase [Bacteroidota bacterium]|nr:S8/S53 family peptidase [Bacteroidota bacterium]